jgi:NADP-dependent 3-hydroxy acid dehydrogenase YdfG
MSDVEAEHVKRTVVITGATSGIGRATSTGAGILLNGQLIFADRGAEALGRGDRGS